MLRPHYKRSTRSCKNRKYGKGGFLYECECKLCGKIILRERDHLLRKKKPCNNCGCLNKLNNSKKHRNYFELSSVYWRTINNHAIKRDLEVTVTKKYIWDLYIKQNKKCALTGRNLVMIGINYSQCKGSQTASLDRVDSSKGYTEGNVQWIHKILQPMKWNYDQVDFIQTCREVVCHYDLTNLEKQADEYFGDV